jgi:hypothetical protein
MLTAWYSPVRARKTLEVFAGQSVSGSWASVFNAAVTEFNNMNLGVQLVTGPNVKQPDPNNTSGADVWVEVGTKKKFKVLGGEPEVTVPPLVGGKTDPLGPGPKGPIVKVLILVKTLTISSTSGHGRPLGDGVHKCTLLHEFIHACGLSNDEHTFDDIFCSVLTPKSPSQNPQNDIVESITGRRMPPVFVGPQTQTRIQSNWP